MYLNAKHRVRGGDVVKICGEKPVSKHAYVSERTCDEPHLETSDSARVVNEMENE